MRNQFSLRERQLIEMFRSCDERQKSLIEVCARPVNEPREGEGQNCDSSRKSPNPGGNSPSNNKMVVEINPLAVVSGIRSPAKKNNRASGPAIPIQLKRGLKLLESGDVDVVTVIATGEGNGLFQFSAGPGANGFLKTINMPFIKPNVAEREGNVIKLSKVPSDVEQILAIGQAFASGHFYVLHLLVRHVGGKVEEKTFRRDKAASM